jgi:hypothetical protein
MVTEYATGPGSNDAGAENPAHPFSAPMAVLKSHILLDFEFPQNSTLHPNGDHTYVIMAHSSGH